MKIGFTGTQKGMSVEQKQTFNRFFENVCVAEFHHGDCVGADNDAHEIMAKDHYMKIVIHPPKNPLKRAFCEDYDEIRKKKEYLDRNHDIVDETECLWATPSGFQEELRSGTWATIRYAKKKGSMVLIIWPDGSSVFER